MCKYSVFLIAVIFYRFDFSVIALKVDIIPSKIQDKNDQIQNGSEILMFSSSTNSTNWKIPYVTEDSPVNVINLNNLPKKQQRIGSGSGSNKNKAIRNNANNYWLNSIDSYISDPPPHEQVAKMARFIVENSNWTSLATISSRSPTKGFPFANIFSVSDGPIGNSTGIPYFYFTPLEISVKDLKVDGRASMTMSLAQSDYCRIHQYDPEDPRCAHVILTGHILEVPETSPEGQFAQESLFSKHPEMKEWPKDHDWFFAKLQISDILVLDYFGGAKNVPAQDYFKAY